MAARAVRRAGSDGRSRQRTRGVAARPAAGLPQAVRADAARVPARGQTAVGASGPDLRRRGLHREVAYRWGFSSPSRFARYYREYFGTLPSEANRRGYAVAPQQQLPDELRPDAAGQRGADTGR
ncbi:helix-turn-helix domain-containing protein [Nakamurella sp. DB0629]|uniref:Helix-turn-helix domain-containing protein n=1 Tax=Nakamurella aerolata TaxID=1656892 RepID=A0A849ACF6_9ACTN|nr:helix-turn-helix domain-containing protein [Nakamurella aerolata]